MPLNYDRLYFINKENYCNGYDDTPYLKAEYEGEEIILDTKGKEILRSTGTFGYMSFELDSDTTDNTPYFYESISSADKTTVEKYKFYNRKWELLSEVNNRKKIGDIIWLSNKCYIDWTVSDVIIFDYNGKEIQRFDKGLGYKFKNNDLYNIYLIILGNKEELEEIILDSNGSIQSSGIITFDEYLTKYNESRTNSKKSNEKYNLYQSNGTWKLEDADGKALYEERYFERLKLSGENDCIALTNEDNQICIIGRDGTKYVDYGVLEYVKEDGEINFISGEEKIQLEKGIFEGKNSLIIPVKGETGYDIYFYKGK